MDILNQLWNKQSSFRWFKPTWRSCHITIMQWFICLSCRLDVMSRASTQTRPWSISMSPAICLLEYTTQSFDMLCLLLIADGFMGFIYPNHSGCFTANRAIVWGWGWGWGEIQVKWQLNTTKWLCILRGKYYTWWLFHIIKYVIMIRPKQTTMSLHVVSATI